MLFFLSLAFYILSVVAALLLMITAKKLSIKLFNILLSFHFTALIISLFIICFLPSNEGGGSFFFAVCSALWLSGWVFRTRYGGLLKGYLVLYAVTFVWFLFSPSSLMNFLLRTNNSGSGDYLLYENYYIEKQNTYIGSSASARYKLIQKRGIFHQTIARDIIFGEEIDSVRLIEKSDTLLIMRGYLKNMSDSSDAVVQINQWKDRIEVRRKTVSS